MHLVDLTETHDGGRADLAAELHEHYVRFWSSRSGAPCELARNEVRHRIALLGEMLGRSARAFERLGLPDPPDAIAFLGHATSNGHAGRFNGSVFAWFALERYASAASFEAFVPHELAHAFHYRLVPAFEFSTLGEQRATGRQVMTEGLATRAAQCASGLEAPSALWADFLTPAALRNWMQAAHEGLASMARIALASWDEALPGNPLFTANARTGPAGNRGGYLLGLEATRLIQRHRRASVADLLALDRGEAEQLYRSALTTIASGSD